MNDFWARPQYKQRGPHPQGPSSLGGSNQEESTVSVKQRGNAVRGSAPRRMELLRDQAGDSAVTQRSGTAGSHHGQLSIRGTRGEVLFPKPGDCGHLVGAGITTQGKSERKKYPGFSLPAVASCWQSPMKASCPGSLGEAAPRGSSLPSEKANNRSEAKQAGASPRVHH